MDDIWLLFGIVVMVVVFVGFYCFIVKLVYQVDVYVWVEGNDNMLQVFMQMQMGVLINSGLQQVLIDVEIEIIKSCGVVVLVVDQFKLNFMVVLKMLLVIGSFVVCFVMLGMLLWLWFGLKLYVWGGEVVDIDMINVVLVFEGKKLMLMVGLNGIYLLVDENGMWLLVGCVGELVQGGGVMLFVQKFVVCFGM